MLGSLIKALFQKKSEDITVTIDPDAPSLKVRLSVNNLRQAWMECVIDSDTSILIGDILHNRERPLYNRGYGSMMMEKLLEYAHENGYSFIHGNLAVCDLGHKERLHHFYQKFGFVITEYPEWQDNYYGKIELLLPDNNRTE